MSHSHCDHARQCRPAHQPHQSKKMPRRPQQSRATSGAVTLLALAATVPGTTAQANCVSLQGSSTCPAFSQASISTNLTGDLYVEPRKTRVDRPLTLCSSFLSFVSDVQSFDNQLRSYISTTYTQRQ